MGEGNPTGGSVELARVIDEAGEYLIADLRERYGIDLRELFSEDHPLSPRWALAHVRHLPLGSAFIAEQRGGQEFRGWDVDRYALAALVDASRTQNYAFILANIDQKKTRKPEPPAMWPIPDDLKKKKAHKPGGVAWQLIQARKRKETICQAREAEQAKK